jgi:trk system potassium uptake protein TrkH
VIVGGLGFPLIIELIRRRRRHMVWTIHTRLTMWGTLGLLVIGVGFFAVLEWTNPGTLGPLPTGEKITGALAGGVFPRTAGYNSIDYGAATPETLAVTNLLMFIGGGSAGTAGGIKITTFLLLAFVIWTEVKGDDHVVVGKRSVGAAAQRQALSVALLGVAAVALGTFALLLLTDYGLEPLLFESISAFGTVGLTTGLTSELNAPSELVLMALMFVGRVGTVTVATALALNQRPRLYHLPEERPIIG